MPLALAYSGTCARRCGGRRRAKLVVQDQKHVRYFDSVSTTLTKAVSENSVGCDMLKLQLPQQAGGQKQSTRTCCAMLQARRSTSVL